MCAHARLCGSARKDAAATQREVTVSGAGRVATCAARQIIASMDRPPASSASEQLAIARALASKLATTARERDRDGGTPRAERKLIRDSGLLTIGIPRAFGGGGAAWPTIMQVVQILAAADASLA